MNHSSTHLSDFQLKQIVSEQLDVQTIPDAESHIANCAECQQRLISAAAGDQWRDEFREGISDLIRHPESTHIFSDTLALEKNVVGDEFDLYTVKNLLGEILSPSIHSDTFGQLGRYEIERIIGCGGMGVVLKGFDHELHRPVAIKMILPKYSRNGVAKQRFMQEARAAATVLHPNVIEIHDISNTNSIPWFVMTYVAGPSLRSLVERDGPLAEKEIIRIASQIASGLAVAHQKGIVHRDIKPENILVDNQVNRVVITDFGLAWRNTDQRMTETGILAGSVGYMSPEQSRGDEVDGRSDLFSLGSLLYFLGTGESPFSASNIVNALNKINNEKHQDPRRLNPDLSATFSKLVDQLLQKDPNQRFDSASDLEGFLSNYLAHLHQPTTQPTPLLPSQGRSKNFLKVGTVFVSAIVLAVAAIWSVYSLPKSEITEPTNYEAIKNHGLPKTILGDLEQEIGQLKNEVDILESPSRPDVEDSLENELQRLDSEVKELEDEINKSIFDQDQN